jgi:hypothetical protein
MPPFCSSPPICVSSTSRDRVGYRDFAQFSEAFRRYHAVTPGALRRAGRDDAAPTG